MKNKNKITFENTAANIETAIETDGNPVHYNKEECTYGSDSEMSCEFCSSLCSERIKYLTEKGIKIEFL